MYNEITILLNKGNSVDLSFCKMFDLVFHNVMFKKPVQYKINVAHKNMS